VLSLVLVSWFPQVGCAPHCSSAESDFSAVPTLSFCRQEAARFRSCAKERFFSALSSGQFVIFLLKNFWPSSRFSVEDFSSRSSAREPVHPDLGFRSSLFIFPAVSRFRVEIFGFRCQQPALVLVLSLNQRQYLCSCSTGCVREFFSLVCVLGQGLVSLQCPLLFWPRGSREWVVRLIAPLPNQFLVQFPR
jgi:hypothetical protein